MAEDTIKGVEPKLDTPPAADGKQPSAEPSAAAPKSASRSKTTKQSAEQAGHAESASQPKTAGRPPSPPARGRQRPRRQRPARLLQARRKPARQRPALSRPAARRNRPHLSSRRMSRLRRPTMAARKLRQRLRRPHAPPTPTQPNPQTGQMLGRAATLRREGPSRQPVNARGTHPDPVRSTIQASPPSGPAPNRPTRTSPPAQPSLAAPTGPAPINRHPRGTSGPARPARRQLRIAGDSLTPNPYTWGVWPQQKRSARSRSESLRRLAAEPATTIQPGRAQCSAATSGPVSTARAPARAAGEGCQASTRLHRWRAPVRQPRRPLPSPKSPSQITSRCASWPRRCIAARSTSSRR